MSESVPVEKLEALAKRAEVGEFHWDPGLQASKVALLAKDIRALLSEARERGKPPWDRICPVCGHGFAVDLNDAPASAGTEGPGLRETLRQITHPDEGPCPVCSAIFDSHIEGCPYGDIDAALADRPVEGEKK